MKINLQQADYSRALLLYKKLSSRLDKALKANYFKDYSTRKRQYILSKIEKLKARIAKLELVLKFSGSALVLGLTLCATDTNAQTPSKWGREFRVNTETMDYQSVPSTAMDANGDFLVVYKSAYPSYGIYGQHYTKEGVKEGSEFVIVTGSLAQPQVAMDDDGDYVVTYMKYGGASSIWDIYARRFNAADVPQGNEFLVNTHTTMTQDNPDIAMDSDGDFVITWRSDEQDGSGDGVYAQRFNALGVAQGSEFNVSTFDNNHQSGAQVAMDDDGDFVITWMTRYLDHNFEAQIAAQRYNASGVAQGSEFPVNSRTTGQQLAPDIACDDNGNFVVVWQSGYQDNNGYGVYGQLFTSTGAVQGSEFKVNTTTIGDQERARVAMDSDGDFVVSWVQGYFSSGDIYAQRFTSSGAMLGNEFAVNTYSTSQQAAQTLAMNNIGDFVVAWHSEYQDGSELGVYGQMFTIRNQSPVIADQNFSIIESSTATTSVGDVVATDPNGIQTLTYSIVDGNDGNAFGIDPATGEITVVGTLDYETQSTYALIVQVEDNGTPVLSNEATVTIFITDDPETTSASEAVLWEDFKLYPNPSSGEIVIKGDNLSQGNFKIRIVNSLGDEVYSSPFSELISLSFLNKGVYALELYNDKQSFRKKIVLK